MTQSAKRIWLITDGRAGNRSQARALGDAFGRLLPVALEEHALELRGWAKPIPPAIAHGLGLAPISYSAPQLAEPWPDLIVGTGRRSAPIVAWLGRRSGRPAIQLLDPQMPARAFHTVIAPEHDDLTGANVLQSLGSLSPVTPARIAEACRTAGLPEATDKPALAVLIGGDGRSWRLDSAAILDALDRLANDHFLLVTPSRRTPGPIRASLTEALKGRGFVWQFSGPNPYPGLLHPAEAVLVTADSVNMASEAASTGKPVHILPVDGLPAKFRKFHQALERHGASRVFAGRIEKWSYPPLAEADRITAELLPRLGW